ncbi:hypothetical protein H5410_037583 [Solanum commersonii]|uniref:Uncharacterized protein n=1 Tax=Solanum commersonii TaxID=4109 RepID=A0A9J5Y8V5_SOLCO|nr:hypothetical protein H5410_037583 [Solanum commersonii]
MTDDSTSVKHMARKISNHDEGEQDDMIMKYLEEVKKKILLNLTHYAKSDSSMRSETSEDITKLNHMKKKVQEMNQESRRFFGKTKGQDVAVLSFLNDKGTDSCSSTRDI